MQKRTWKRTCKRNLNFQWHGTYRQKDRIYHEDVFFGRGKALDEATAEEFEQVGD